MTFHENHLKQPQTHKNRFIETKQPTNSHQTTIRKTDDYNNSKFITTQKRRAYVQKEKKRKEKKNFSSPVRVAMTLRALKNQSPNLFTVWWEEFQWIHQRKEEKNKTKNKNKNKKQKNKKTKKNKKQKTKSLLFFLKNEREKKSGKKSGRKEVFLIYKSILKINKKFKLLFIFCPSRSNRKPKKSPDIDWRGSWSKRRNIQIDHHSCCSIPKSISTLNKIGNSTIFLLFKISFWEKKKQNENNEWPGSLCEIVPVCCLKILKKHKFVENPHPQDQSFLYLRKYYSDNSLE